MLYFGLIDKKISPADKDLPVRTDQIAMFKILFTDL